MPLHVSWLIPGASKLFQLVGGTSYKEAQLYKLIYDGCKNALLNNEAVKVAHGNPDKTKVNEILNSVKWIDTELAPFSPAGEGNIYIDYMFDNYNEANRNTVHHYTRFTNKPSTLQDVAKNIFKNIKSNIKPIVSNDQLSITYGVAKMGAVVTLGLYM